MILPERVFGRSGSRTIRFGAATAYADKHVSNEYASLVDAHGPMFFRTCSVSSFSRSFSFDSS